MEQLSEYYIYQDILETAPSELFQKGTKKNDELIKKLVNSKTDGEFYMELERFFDVVRGGHLGFMQGDYYSVVSDPPCSYDDFLTSLNALESAEAKSPRNFPTYVNYYNLESAAVVEKSASPLVVTGDRIVEVCDKPVREFFSNTKFRYQDPSKFKVELLTADGKTDIVYIDTNADEKPILWDSTKSASKELKIQYFDDMSIAYLRIPSMSISCEGDIKRFFYDSSKYDNVILDVRGNGGGDYRISDLLASFVARVKPYSKIAVPYNGTQLVRKGKASEQFQMDMMIPNSVVEKIDDTPDFNGIQNEIYDAYKIKYTFSAIGHDSYGGNIFVLQNEDCFSATGRFLEIIRSEDYDATTVEKAAGMGELAQYIIFIMPESKWSFCIEQSMYVNEQGELDIFSGVSPDYEVEKASAEVMAKFYSENPNGDFFTSEYDPQFMKVMELIAK